MTTLVRTSCAIASALLALALGACDRQTPPAAKKAEVPVANLPAEPPPPVAAPEKAAEPPEVAADKELAGKVKSALLAERSLNAHGIDVVAKNGTVTLFGTAETVVRRDTAGKVARNVAGVKSVENKLAVVAGS
jgi:hyperosmotically inducible periplasmic protein